MEHTLDARLAAAGIEIDSIADPQEAFEALVASGAQVTLGDRLELEARSRDIPIDELPAGARRGAVEGFYGLRWEGFEIVGRDRNDRVEVVDYDPSWPARFEAWRETLAAALGPIAVGIEHVGSTAVPGLAAKPVIDIQVSVMDLDDETGYVPAIEAAGIALRSRDGEHRYFRPAPGQPRDVQVHVCRAGDAWERDHLVFRDYLRAHDPVRDEYAALKRRLAADYPDDRLAYTEAKGEFVAEVLRLASDSGG